MPVVIALMSGNPLWNFPPTRGKVEEQLGNLLLAVLLTLRTAGHPAKSHLYDLLPAPQGDMKSCRITAVAQLSRPLCAGLDG